jgi:RNA polymerase sigma-70 factor, ECF subfamily
MPGAAIVRRHQDRRRKQAMSAMGEESVGASAPPDASRLFHSVVLPHLDEAHRLVRYLTGCRADADDVLQEASVRMLRFVHTFRDGDARSWVLSVARNAAFSWMRAKRRGFRAGNEHAAALPVESALDTAVDEREEAFAVEARRRESEALRRAIDAMPRGQREVIVLRDLGGLDYAEIASKLQLPIGTVMSRLSRGRALLKRRLTDAPDAAVAMPTAA